MSKIVTSALRALVVLAGTASTAIAVETEHPVDTYTKLCATCHVTKGPPTAAPPIFAVKAHVLEAYPERDAFISYIVQWVNAPDGSNSLMPGAVRRFGLMPKLGYDPAEVRRIAEFLYDTPLSEPAWFRAHFEAEHGRPPRR